MPITRSASFNQADQPQSKRGSGFLRSFGLSLLVHALLIAALTWGVNWRQQSNDTAVQAELWASTVQQAPPPPSPAPVVEPALAPKPEPEPEPLPEPVKQLEPEPFKPEPAKPTPVPTVKPIKPEPLPPPEVDPQIAIEKAKKLKALKEKQAKELALLEAKKAEERALEKERQEAALADKRAKDAKLARLAKEKERAEQERQEKLKTALQAKAEAEKIEKARREASKLEDAKAQAAAERSRADALRRMNQMAGQVGGSESARDKQNAAPSDGYLGRIAGRIKPNVVYTGDKNANIATIFEVRVNPEGRVVSIQMTASSGVRAWDDAAYRAIEKTEIFPLDDGRVHSPLSIRMTPRD